MAPSILGRHSTASYMLIASAILASPGSAQTPAAAPAAAVPETGTTCDALVSFDRLMRSFLCENDIPGAALAVARHGRLIYARGFGYVDIDRHAPVQPDPVQPGPVQPDTLFRIASVSKPITAAAILKLWDDGRLGLDDRVLSLLPPIPPLAAQGGRDPRLQNVTVRHLLQHRGGWDRELSFDPMFRSVEIATSLGIRPPATSHDMVRFMLSQPLDFEPGIRYAYSNFGYCLLGRVIEHASGTDYETYVRRELLSPMGIERMRIGKTMLAGRAGGETRYYEPGSPTGPAVVGDDLGVPVPRPYGAWYVEAMDAHGGWIASAVDLVRFATRLQSAQPLGPLSRKSLEAISACPPGAAGHDPNGALKDSYYGLGWSVRPVGREGKYNLWHTGLFSGSSTLLVIRHDGLCWAVLFNTSATADGRAPAEKIDSLVHQAADAVGSWPARDLFDEFLTGMPVGR